jgi:phosphate transport system protein
VSDPTAGGKAWERPFHHKIDDLKLRVAKMAELAKSNVLEGVAAFRDLDLAKADGVIARNEELNRMDVEIEKEALDLIALHQPMATDLRTIGATLKIITYLDRIGRLGYDIAHAAKRMEGKQHVKRPLSIPHMGELGAKMLDQAIAAYLERDAEKARALYGQDDLVDALYEQIFRECLTYMMEDPKNITPCANYILVARHLERIADNTIKIAEKTIYMVTGERRLGKR